MNERLRRDEWTVQGVPTHGEMVRLIRDGHYAKGAPNTSTYRHGLYRVGAFAPLVGELCGVALWLPPTRRAAESVAGHQWRGVLCLSRLYVAPEVPPNGASFLLGRSMRLIDRERWPVLLTYADTSHGHTGAIYRATNWTCLGETPAGDVWTDSEGGQWGRKRGGRNYSVEEMHAAGLVRTPAAPKIKFIHAVP